MRLGLISFLFGALFGIGLTVSQISNPAKVIGFLDLAGDWDPTLAFVLGGALIGAFPGMALAKRRVESVLGATMRLPTRLDIDRPLLLGSALFGIGWGIGGFCPGPALAAIGSGLLPVFVFVAAMLAGMLLYRLIPGRAA